MQDDTGIKRILTLSWVYSLFQNLVGATKGAEWVSDNFWRAQPGHKAVDIGCGPGNTAHLLPKGVHYVGFDVSEKYIGHARETFAHDPDKTFIVGVAEDFVANLPPQMQNADLVIMNGLLHHLDDGEALTALRLARESLSPDGRLVCLEACFLISQAPIAHWVLKQDRGQNVRSEPEWKALVAQVFGNFETYILTGLLRIPYTQMIIEARR
ncbi:MAG: class I SAM-dependent methyltransferase [Rhodanobacter sp.]